MTPHEIIEARKARAFLLKKLRLRKNYNISQLSRLTGLARHTIVKMETGSECWNIDSEVIYIKACKQKKAAS